MTKKTTQKYSSADTCIKHVPAIVRRINKLLQRPAYFWALTDDVLDYGGGKYDLLTDKLAEAGVRNWVYDPYNRTEEHNAFVRKMLSTKRAQHALLSNVLNVIKEPAVRRDVLEDIKTMVEPGGQVFITVWEGDSSSRGRRTTKGWQCNRPAKNYMREIRRVYPGARGYKLPTGGKIIVAEVPYEPGKNSSE